MDSVRMSRCDTRIDQRINTGETRATTTLHAPEGIGRAGEEEEGSPQGNL
jgi:hypothetical protein